MIITPAAAALLAVPFAALGARTSKTVTYTASYQETQPVPVGGKYAGRMMLTFNEDGTVSGRYRDEFAAKGGVITGTLGNRRGPEVYTFTAVPTTS